MARLRRRGSCLYRRPTSPWSCRRRSGLYLGPGVKVTAAKKILDLLKTLRRAGNCDTDGRVDARHRGLRLRLDLVSMYGKLPPFQVYLGINLL